MKTLTNGITMSLWITASAVQAQQTLTINDKVYLMSDLMATCQSMTDDPAGQVACFGNVARLLEEQTGEAPETTMSVTQALDILRSAAEYSDDDTGLVISGSDCVIQTLYYGNYFHVSRRNISEIDLFSAKFDASNIDYDKIVQVQGGQAPLSEGVLNDGAVAMTHGNLALDSSQNGFAARSPGKPLDVYASEVVDQLPATESQTFNFALVHPQRSGTSAAIWDAFEGLVDACKA